MFFLCVTSGFSDFLTLPKNILVRGNEDSKLPLGVNAHCNGLASCPGCISALTVPGIGSGSTEMLTKIMCLLKMERWDGVMALRGI